MKKVIKKAITGIAVAVLSAGIMTGCGSIDGSKTIATVNQEDVPLGVVSYMLRYSQAQINSYYGSLFGSDYDLWSQVVDEESGETYAESTKTSTLESVELMYILRQKAPDYDVTLTEEETEGIKTAAEAFMAANDEETIAELGVTQSMVEEVLELQTYQLKMRNPLIADVDTEVSDEEAGQTSVTYVTVSKTVDSSTEEATDEATADATEEAADEAAVEEAQKEKAQQILDTILKTADADMSTIAADVDETLTASEATYTAIEPETDDEEETSTSTSSLPDEVITAARTLKDGEVYSSLVETDDSFYIVRVDKVFDEEATATQKESIISDREDELYTTTTDAWVEESTIKENKGLLNQLILNSNQTYSFKAAETEEATEEATTEATDEATIEATDEATAAATEEATTEATAEATQEAE
ncbi:MAG: FKBP-type peptidylprolyl isomerase [Lachnospiraceae bacterium]